MKAVPTIGGVSVQRDDIVCPAGQALHERCGLDKVALGAVGRKPVTDLGQGQGGVGVGAI